MLSIGVAHVSWPHTTQDSLNHAELGRLALGVALEDMSIGAVAIDLLVAAAEQTWNSVADPHGGPEVQGQILVQPLQRRKRWLRESRE